MCKSIVCIILSFCLFSPVLFAEQGDVVPRKSLGPKDSARLKMVEAKRWLSLGNAQSLKKNSVANGIGSKSCTTNIGSENANNSKYPKPLGNSSKNPQSIIISGDIINVCK